MRPLTPLACLVLSATAQARPVSLGALTHATSHQCLVAAGGMAQMAACDGKGGQHWVFDASTGALQNRASGQCLESAGRRAPVLARACHGKGGNQQWSFDARRGQWRSPSANLCLTVSAAGPVQLAPCRPGRRQAFNGPATAPRRVVQRPNARRIAPRTVPRAARPGEVAVDQSALVQQDTPTIARPPRPGEAAPQSDARTLAVHPDAQPADASSQVAPSIVQPAGHTEQINRILAEGAVKLILDPKSGKKTGKAVAKAVGAQLARAAGERVGDAVGQQVSKALGKGAGAQVGAEIARSISQGRNPKAAGKQLLKVLQREAAKAAQRKIHKAVATGTAAVNEAIDAQIGSAGR